MRTCIPLAFCFMFFASPLHSDTDKDKKTVQDSFLRRYAETRGFNLGRPVRPKPTPDGKAVLFLRAEPKVPKMSLFEFDVATGKTKELLTPKQLLKGAEEHLTPEEKARRERMRVSVGGFTNFQFNEDGTSLLVSLSGKLYVFNRASNAVKELNTGAGTIVDPKFSPDGKYVSYVRDYDVHAYDLKADKELRITTGGSAKISHGVAEFVAQEEMRRYTGYWWSPDSKSIAYEEADHSKVEVWHVFDPAQPEQNATPFYYPRPGKNNVEVKLGVIKVENRSADSDKATTWISWDAKKYPYLANVIWDKRGPLTLAVQTRDQKEVVLLRADPKTGKTTPLVTEKDPAWVNLTTGLPKWLDDGSQFLWESERDGGPQLEWRAADGKLIRVVVPPAEGFDHVVDLDGKTGRIVYVASKDPTERQLFVVEKDGKPKQLTKERGMHGATYSKDHSIYVLSTTTPESLGVSAVHRADGTKVGDLPSVAEKPPFEPKAEYVKIGDDPGYYAMIVRPDKFDPKKRYPVVVDVYGGPGHAHVRAAPRFLNHWLANQGFIVVAIDNRGTPGRGRDWERALSKKFGSVPLEGQVEGLKALGKKFPEMDLDRVGIIGWSFGGYMSALAVLRRPDVFKAGVAGAPVVDWEDYDTHYTERYMGMPDADKQAYKEANLLTYAGDLKRPLMLEHGTADDNVYFRHTLKLVDALFRAGKEFDLLPLSGTHMVHDPVVTERRWERITKFFKKHLGEPK